MRKLGGACGANVELSFDFVCSDVRKAPLLLLHNNNVVSIWPTYACTQVKQIFFNHVNK